MKRTLASTLIAPQRTLLFSYANDATDDLKEALAQAVACRYEFGDIVYPCPANPTALQNYFSPSQVENACEAVEFVQTFDDVIDEFRVLLTEEVTKDEHDAFVANYARQFPGRAPKPQTRNEEQNNAKKKEDE